MEEQKDNKLSQTLNIRNKSMEAPKEDKKHKLQVRTIPKKKQDKW